MTDEEQVIDSAASPAATDATAPSSEAKPADKPEDSAPSDQADPIETVSDALEKVKPEQVEEKPAEEKAADAAAVDSEAEANTDEPAKSEEKTEGSLDTPFDKRPEWTAAIKALGKDADKVKPILRDLMTRETKLNERVTQLQPLADVTTELEAQCGGKDGFAGTRKLVRLFNESPADSVPMLETLLADARKRAGLEITSTDLMEQSKAIDKQLEEGLIEPAEAQRQRKLLIEAETGRATGKRAQQQAQADQQQQQVRAAQAAMQSKMDAINAWESNARKMNPDFGDVTPFDSPKHGISVADQVFDAICLKFQNNPNATSEQLLVEADRVLKLAKGRLASPVLRTSKPVTSQGSSVTAKPKPKTLREALDQIPAERTA